MTAVSLRSSDNLIRPHFRLCFLENYVMRNILVKSCAAAKYSRRFNAYTWGGPSWEMTNPNPLETKSSPIQSTAVLNSSPYQWFIIKPAASPKASTLRHGLPSPSQGEWEGWADYFLPRRLKPEGTALCEILRGPCLLI